MTRYRITASFGGLTQGEMERVNAAYANYRVAFDEALQKAVQHLQQQIKKAERDVPLHNRARA